MIQVIARPTPTSFAKNPVVYRFRAVDNIAQLPYRAIGARAIFEADLGFQFQDGDTMTLHFTEPDGSNTTVIFTAKDTLSLDTHIPTNTPLSTVTAYIAAHRFIAPHIRVYYTVSGTLESITAEVRVAEIGWLIDFAKNIQSTALSTNLKTEIYLDNNAPDDYGINYEIFYESEYQTRNWQRIHRGILHIRDDGGDIYLNLSDILTAEYINHLKENPFQSVSRNSASLTDNRRRFYIRYKEVGASPATWYSEAAQTIITGGIINQLWLSRDWFYFTTSDINRTWLTHKQAIQSIRLDTPEWVSWYNPIEDPTEFQLEVKWYNQDGQNGEQRVLNSIGTVQGNNIITFCMTPSVLGLSSNVRHYFVRVVMPSTGYPLSTWREYVIDTSIRRNIRTLAYLNSFGCPETVVCTGEFSKNISYQTALTEAVRGVNYAGSITRTERNAFNLDLGYTYRTGYINADTRDILNEVALSPVLFDITTTTYLALVFKAERTGTQTETFYHSDETMYSIEWQTSLKVAIGVFGTDRELREANNLLEPVMSLRGAGTNNDIVIPDFTGNETPPSDGNGGTMTELGELKDSDLIVFARLDTNGTVAGFYTYQNGKYKRLVRGIPFDSPSHLDGIGLKDAETGVITNLHTDKNGSPLFVTQ
jgi:hypothetical protein